jgi:hypothetical protein
MTWFRRHRPSAAEALELELAGIVTDSSAAELRPVTDLLRAAARGLPPPTALRPRRRELAAMGASAAVGQATGRGGRLIRAPMIAFAVATVAVASVLGATLVASWLHVTPPSISEPAGVPDASTGPSDSASEHPHASQSEPPDATDPDATDLMPPLFSDELSAELLAALRAACGEDATLPDLSGINEAEARALVDALIAACKAASATPVPGGTPSVLSDELSAELLAKLQAACGEDATLPDLSGLDEAEARALVDALIAACETVPGTLLP